MGTYWRGGHSNRKPPRFPTAAITLLPLRLSCAARSPVLRGQRSPGFLRLPTRRSEDLIAQDLHGLAVRSRLGKQGVKIIAHENTRLWLSTTVRYEPDGPPFLPLPVSARPNATTYTTGELELDDETARYGHLSQAHTDGDRPFSKADLQAERDILAKLSDQLGKMMRAGYGPAANP